MRQIVLDLLDGSDAGVVGVEMCRPQRTPLSEQVPALIKLCFDAAQLGAEGDSIAAVLLTQRPKYRVLERNKVGHLAQERMLSIFAGHRFPSVIQVTNTFRVREHADVVVKDWVVVSSALTPTLVPRVENRARVPPWRLPGNR